MFIILRQITQIKQTGNNFTMLANGAVTSARPARFLKPRRSSRSDSSVSQHGKIIACLFNLGYLPKDDKRISEEDIATAFKDALDSLKKSGK